jgi:DNA-binding transcriptional MerR regulator
MTTEVAAEQGHAMKVAVRRSGLSPHVIRVWEKRYGAVTPQRTPTNRRLYSDADIQRLLLLRKATLAGHSISHIANLPTARLLDLVATDEATGPPQAPRVQPDTDATLFQSHLEACIAATERLDTSGLETALLQARVALSQPAFIEHLLVPLMENIGELWRDGSLRSMSTWLRRSSVPSWGAP